MVHVWDSKARQLPLIVQARVANLEYEAVRRLIAVPLEDDKKRGRLDTVFPTNCNFTREFLDGDRIGPPAPTVVHDLAVGFAACDG